MTTLNLLVRGGRHAIVAEVVEAKFGISAVSDVATVCLPALRRRHLVLDAAYG